MADAALELLREFVAQGCIATDDESQVNQCFWCWQVQPWNACPKEGITHDADCLYARAKAFTDGVRGGSECRRLPERCTDCPQGATIPCPDQDQGPCAICGTTWIEHGCSPACADHNHTPTTAGVRDTQNEQGETR